MARGPWGAMETDRFDVLILTALPEELSALRAIDVNADGPWTAAQDPAGFTYHHRRFLGGGGALRVAAASTGGMGEPATAARATALIDHLDPACLAMCGLCAGDRRDVFLGDVIVADRVYSYDHGKLIATVDADGRRDERFLHDVETYNLDAAWKMDIAEFAQDPSWCAELVRTRPLSLESQERWLLRALLRHGAGGGPSPVDDPERRARCPDWPALVGRLKRRGLIDKSPGVLRLTEEGERRARDHEVLYPDGDPGDPPFRVHVGAIATGKTVRSDPEIWRRLEGLVRKTLGLEMEAAAVGQIAHQRKRRALVVKAVSDGADHDKDDSFRAFAARASAELLLRFLCHKAPLVDGASARPDVASARPDVASARPDGVSARPDGASARPDGVSARPDGASARPDGASARPDGVSARPDGVSARPDVASARPDGASARPDGTSPRPDAGAVAPLHLPAQDRATSAAPPRGNPFQTEGSLEAGHPTYVVRPCDAALAEALAEAPLISLEGEFRIGKSSLLLRAHDELARVQRACFLDLSGFRVDDEHVFYRSLFHQLSRKLKLDRPLSDWHELGDEAGDAPLALCFDEFGHLTPALLASFVPSLHHLATRPDRPVQIVVCLPGSIELFLQRSGPKNPKYSSGFRRIQIGPLDDAGLSHLLGLLPERARSLADAHRGQIAALSAGHPRAVQALCRRLFDAAEERAPEGALVSLIHDRRAYE